MEPPVRDRQPHRVRLVPAGQLQGQECVLCFLLAGRVGALPGDAQVRGGREPLDGALFSFVFLECLEPKFPRFSCCLVVWGDQPECTYTSHSGCILRFSRTDIFRRTIFLPTSWNPLLSAGALCWAVLEATATNPLQIDPARVQLGPRPSGKLSNSNSVNSNSRRSASRPTPTPWMQARPAVPSPPTC